MKGKRSVTVDVKCAENHEILVRNAGSLHYSSVN